MKRLLDIVKLLLGLPISILALFFIIRLILEKTTFSNIQLQNIQPFFLFLGMLSFIVYFFFRALLWQKILYFKGYNFPFKETVFLWASSEFKRYVPGNIWSFLSRFLAYSNKNIEKKQFLSGLIEEGQAVVMGSGLLSVFSFSFILYTLFPYPDYTKVLLILSYTLTFLIILFYLGKNFKKNIILLFISFFSFLFFSLGVYFSISSLFYLSPLFITTFISFFAFSYLAGYLSFVVPMGIGIREGAIALGLSHFILFSSAGIGAIFARIIIIFSELIFLSLTFFWYKLKNKYIENTERFIKQYYFEIILIIFIIIYCIYFTSASFLRYDNFFTGKFDLGNMDQTVWNTYNGRLFQLTNPDSTENASRLSVHADFILILIAPLYTIWKDPRLLLLIQTIILSFGSIFIYFLAKKVLNNKFISLCLAAIYLLNPNVNYSNLYDFHAIVLGTTFLLGAFYFLYTQKYIKFILFTILAGITKENVWLVNSFFGLYLTLTNFSLPFNNLKKTDYKKVMLGLFVFLSSILIFYYLLWHAIPNARGAEHFALSYYSNFGNSPGNIIKNIIFSPQKTIDTVLSPDRLEYLFYLILPLGFLPIFAPFILIFSSPDLAITLLSNNVQLRQVYYQYSAPITPFLFIAAIFGIKNLIKKFPKISFSYLGIFLILSTLYTAYLLGPLPFSKYPNINMFIKPQKNKELINMYLSSINESYSVAATNNLGSHLSQREKIYTIPMGIDTADIIVFLLNDPYAQPSLDAQKKMAEDLKSNPNYRLVFEKDDFVFFQRK